VLGGVEASLRRIAHYDFWSDTVRRSILFDARADILAYGMAEKAVLDIALSLASGKGLENIRGTCVIAADAPPDYLELPSFEQAGSDKKAFARMFDLFCANNDPATARGLYQKYGNRCLVHHPPQPHLSEAQLDAVYALPFTRRVHPFYDKQGAVRAMDTIAFSLTTHRGCFGECRFCSIALHEGRTILSRSEASILDEAARIAAMKNFKGYITDVGGATANMYGIDCARKPTSGACRDKRCLFPRVCPSLSPDHSRQIRLHRKLRGIPGVKKVFVASGIRHDLVLADRKAGQTYLNEMIRHALSGRMKIAPEHVADDVLRCMGKPPVKTLTDFKNLFDRLNKEAGVKQFLSYYFIAAHPGCTDEHMRELARFAHRELKTSLDQVQIFTPLPSTWSALMYFAGIDPKTGRKIFVEKSAAGRQKQKSIVTAENKPRSLKAGPDRTCSRRPECARKIRKKAR